MTDAFSRSKRGGAVVNTGGSRKVTLNAVGATPSKKFPEIEKKLRLGFRCILLAAVQF